MNYMNGANPFDIKRLGVLNRQVTWPPSDVVTKATLL